MTRLGGMSRSSLLSVLVGRMLAGLTKSARVLFRKQAPMKHETLSVVGCPILGVNKDGVIVHGRFSERKKLGHRNTRQMQVASKTP
jgi:hypothetical protein